MRFAKDFGDNAIEPGYSGQTATCYCCGQTVRAKCGRLNAWHWAHEAGDCDSFAEPMTAWHLAWQKYLQAELGAKLEQVVRRDQEIHRADAVLPEGRVVELQHSSLSVQEIEKREHFYGVDRMLWVFDLRDAFDASRLLLRDRGSFHSFRWKHARKSIAACMAPVRLDIGGGYILKLKKMYVGPPCGGWGVLAHHPELERAIDIGDGEEF